MLMLSEKEAEGVRNRLRALSQPVRLVYFTEGRGGLIIPGRECRYCGETQRLLEDVARCSPQLTMEVYDRITDPGAFASHGVDKVPGLAVIGAQDYGVRFYGLPAGYELATLLDIIVDVGRGSTGLTADTRATLTALPADVWLQVFVTPT